MINIYFLLNYKLWGQEPCLSKLSKGKKVQFFFFFFDTKQLFYDYFPFKKEQYHVRITIKWSAVSLIFSNLYPKTCFRDHNDFFLKNIVSIQMKTIQFQVTQWEALVQWLTIQTENRRHLPSKSKICLTVTKGSLH